MVSIGERRPPQPEGRRGYLCIDTVHQPERDGEKSVYHINAVDEVTQWEVLGCVPKISEHYLIAEMDAFYQGWFNRYLNYHRPCGFATVKTDAKGKAKKVYDVYVTPYERLKSLPRAKRVLRPGVSFQQLECIATAENDTELAGKMQKAKQELFRRCAQAGAGLPGLLQTLASAPSTSAAPTPAELTGRRRS